MRGQVIRQTIVVVMLAIAAGGCATKERQRITMLEETNTKLTERLNLSRSEFDAMTREHEDLDNRLMAALDEVDVLKEQLAERPVPQETAAGWTPVPGGAMIAIEGNVLYAPGKITLRKEARRTLDAVVSTIQGEYADKDVFVFGHTDDQPIKKSGWMDNYQLSTERALAVVRYLRDRGVSPKRLAACGCGEHRPQVQNMSEVNRTANRRVEVFAIDPQMRTLQP